MKFRFNFSSNLFLLICLLQLLFISCEKKEEENSPVKLEFDSVIDIDKNTYYTVKINGKWWMMQDLKVKTFNDSTPVFNAQNTNNWVEKRAAFCIYRDNEESPGLLYNWYAVNSDRKLAPAGWHIATDDEWKDLEKFLELNESEAEQIGWRGEKLAVALKAFGKKFWKIDDINTYPNNSSGLSLNAGSCRLPNGLWGDPGLFHTGFWWTSTEKDSSKSYFRHLDYKSNKVFRFYESKHCGYSVRCVKD